MDLVFRPTSCHHDAQCSQATRFHPTLSRELVETCAQLAFHAPNGSNQQGWGWVFVDDRETRAAMADLYRKGLQDHLARDRTVSKSRTDRRHTAPQSESVSYLIEHMQDSPCSLCRRSAALWRHVDVHATSNGAILPRSGLHAACAVVARSAWTTLSLYREDEMASCWACRQQRTQQTVPDRVQIAPTSSLRSRCQRFARLLESMVTR